MNSPLPQRLSGPFRCAWNPIELRHDVVIRMAAAVAEWGQPLPPRPR